MGRGVLAFPAGALLSGLAGCASHGTGTFENPRIVPSLPGIGIVRLEQNGVFIQHGSSPDALFNGIQSLSNDQPVDQLHLSIGDGFSRTHCSGFPFSLDHFRDEYQLIALRDGMTVWNSDCDVQEKGFLGLSAQRTHRRDVIATKPYNRQLDSIVLWTMELAGPLPAH